MYHVLDISTKNSNNNNTNKKAYSPRSKHQENEKRKIRKLPRIRDNREVRIIRVSGIEQFRLIPYILVGTKQTNKHTFSQSLYITAVSFYNSRKKKRKKGKTLARTRSGLLTPAPAGQKWARSEAECRRAGVCTCSRVGRVGEGRR